jgi:hypothetical protein
MTRTSLRYGVALCALGAALAAQTGWTDSAALDALTSKDAATGLRTALAKGIAVAVSQLGAPNGFLNDPKVAIPLPPALDKADNLLRKVGMGGQADELRVTMNHAAEQAVAQAKPIFESALHHMTLSDAKGILTGGDGAGTAYFRHATSDQLTAKFKPVVAATTATITSRPKRSTGCSVASRTRSTRSARTRWNRQVRSSKRCSARCSSLRPRRASAVAP